MQSLRTLLLGILVVRFVVSAIVALVITVVAFLAIPNLIQSGQIPAAPLGLEYASMGVPAKILGVPTTYVLGIALFDLMTVFGNGGGSSSGGGGGEI
jgi:hypothetical protein